MYTCIRYCCACFSWIHDDVIKWKHFLRYWPFVRRIHRSPVNSPHKGQWRGALMFSVISTGINGWVNYREAGDFGRHRAHYDDIVMYTYFPCCSADSEKAMVLPRYQCRYHCEYASNHATDSTNRTETKTVYYDNDDSDITVNIIHTNLLTTAHVYQAVPTGYQVSVVNKA